MKKLALAMMFGAAAVSAKRPDFQRTDAGCM